MSRVWRVGLVSMISNRIGLSYPERFENPDSIIWAIGSQRDGELGFGFTSPGANATLSPSRMSAKASSPNPLIEDPRGQKIGGF